jgi:hypothetical protein
MLRFSRAWWVMIAAFQREKKTPIPAQDRGG